MVMFGLGICIGIALYIVLRMMGYGDYVAKDDTTWHDKPNTFDDPNHK